MSTQTQIEDLWPHDIAEQPTVTPLAILREQASLLSKKTRNLVEGQVYTESRNSHKGESRVYHTFALVVPALDNYSYDLFRISHSVMLYPINVEMYSAPEINYSYNLQNEEEFKNWLKDILAPHTKRILGALIAQAST